MTKELQAAIAFLRKEAKWPETRLVCDSLEQAVAQREEIMRELIDRKFIVVHSERLVDRDEGTRVTWIEHGPVKSIDIRNDALKGTPAPRCPTCDSPKRDLHPRTGRGFEVSVCADDWHEGPAQGEKK